MRNRVGQEHYEIFVLYYESGLTHAEIAELIGRDRKTVRERIAKTHRALEKFLK